jgi:hypothetical protein
MSWNITDRFPSWGETGESPPDGFFYEGGDQVNEKHLDYLWNAIKGLEDDTQAALDDIDSDADGKVDAAETAESATDAENVTATYKGNDIDSDGDGIVDQADSVTDPYTDSDAITAVDGEVDNSASTVAGLDDLVSTINNNYLSELNNNTSVTGSVDFGSYGVGFEGDWLVDTVGTSEFNIAKGVRLYFEINSDVDNQSVTTLYTDQVEVQNDFSVGGNKNFVIPHPSDSNKKLRHGTYEGPVGGGLIYRDRVEVVDGTAKPDFPDYILNGEFGTDWIQSVTPVKHFGTGYLDIDTWTVHADSDGIYDVILMGQRNDNAALSGKGGITTKNVDESWSNAADRFYGGADDIDGNEVATDDDEYRQTTLYAHAESQYESEQ